MIIMHSGCNTGVEIVYKEENQAEGKEEAVGGLKKGDAKCNYR